MSGPANKRNNAFNDIFGRPTASAPPTQPPPQLQQHPSQYYHQPPADYPSSNQHFQQHPYPSHQPSYGGGYTSSNHLPPQPGAYVQPQHQNYSQQTLSGRRSLSGQPYPGDAYSNPNTPRSSYYNASPPPEPQSSSYLPYSYGQPPPSNAASLLGVDGGSNGYGGSGAGGKMVGGQQSYAANPQLMRAQSQSSYGTGTSTGSGSGSIGSYSSQTSYPLSSSSPGSASPALTMSPNLSPMSAFAPLPTGPPPRLPELAISDDFIGFESSRASQHRESFDSSWSGHTGGGAGGAGLQYPGMGYGSAGTAGYGYGGTSRSQNGSPHSFVDPPIEDVDAFSSLYQYGSQSFTSHNGGGGSYSPSLHPRRSSESVRVMPTQPKANYAGQDRAFSFSTTERPDMRALAAAGGAGGSLGSRPSMPSSLTSSNFTSSFVAPKAPVVYPALLSRVAEAFKARITLSERAKDGLVYADTFDGREAVDKIAYIIKTTDRNLALLLGRALDAQKFFHDVTYDHRLRDSPAELYQFRERLATLRGDAPIEDSVAPHEYQQQQHSQPQSLLPAAPARQRSTSITDTVASEDATSFPSGVFTLLTDCYSPTCTRDRLCYSIACPRRLEQQARLNLKPKPGLQRSLSSESLGDDFREPGSLWIHSVPQEVIDSTPDQEKKRQEILNEVFSTERDFVRDIEYLRDSWIKPLRASNIIPESRREDFLQQVFWNILDIHAVNVRLAELFNKRQKQAHVVEKIGDILLEMVPHFSPFVDYGAHQLYGKYEFEKEKASNPAFAKFVEETERLPESRKLELNGYLTKPTTRLARYPLLLEACLKQTADDNPDKTTLPKVVKLVREFLQKVNVETGKSENRFNLAQLDQQLVFRNGEAVDLRLRDKEREMLHKGPLKKRGGAQGESAELTVYLFDHAVLMVKEKGKNEQYKVYRKPIPLELLVVAPLEDSAAARGGAVRPKSLMSRTAPRYLANAPPGADKNSKQGFAMTFIHLGRHGYQITLWASSWAIRKEWLQKIEGRQQELRDRSLIFETQPLSAGYFVGTNRVTCAAPFDNGNRMVYGTDNGVYLSNSALSASSSNPSKVPVKVISVPNVTQLDVLEEQGILIVLADKAVQTFFVDNLDPGDAVGAAKRARKISLNATFFKAGQCLGRTLVCVVKSGSVSSTIKTLEPVDSARGKKQPAIRKFLQGSNDSLRVFKEFYIPTESSSVHFLKSKLCVGCTKGFEIVDLETLDTQGLLDPADSSLDFVQKRENARPIAIYRIDGDFLLCYDEFAFYVNKNGWRAKSNWLIQWEGYPTSFALHYPYVLAFEPTFVEVRHVESGALMQIIPGNSLRCLFADTPPSSSSSSSYYTPYGQPRFPQPHAGRSEIIIGDLDRVFLVRLAPNSPVARDGM